MHFLYICHAKSSYEVLNMLSPDTHFGTDFKLIANATGFLCSCILPVVPLYLGYVVDVVDVDVVDAVDVDVVMST